MSTLVAAPPSLLLRRICVVDDNPVVGMRVQKLLNSRGFRNVTVFRSALPALAACRDCLPDLVLVDYGMPLFDGISFIETLRHYPLANSVPIVMFTGQPTSSLRQRALDAGANEVLSKDLTGAELLSHVQALLDNDAAPVAVAPSVSERVPASSEDKPTTNHAGWGELAQYSQESSISPEDTCLLGHLERIAALRDRNTGHHTQRMAHYAAVIGRRYGLTATQAQMLCAAAPLHDLGKIGVPDTILQKSSLLSPEESVLMRRHPALGHQLLFDSPSPVIRLGAEIALTHHERWDGSGYPQGLRGTAIPLAGRLVSVADVLDALTTSRPYKPAWPLEQAITEIREHSGSHFDPQVVDAVVHTFDEICAVKSHFEGDKPYAKTSPMPLI